MSGPAGSLAADRPRLLRTLLDRTFWVVLAGFVAVVAAFTRDRACADHLNLLPQAAMRPALAWAIAVAYASAYAWLALAIAVTVGETGSLVPRLHEVRAVWGRTWRLALLLLVFVVDYLPPAVLRVGATLCGGITSTFVTLKKSNDADSTRVSPPRPTRTGHWRGRTPG